MQKKEIKLINAAKSNKFEDLRKLFEKIDKAKAKRKLKENIDIDAKDSTGMTALHFSGKNGNVEMMVYLVSRGACIESIDQNGWRPISYACANNHINAVKTLIQWKSNVNKFSLMEENSPLHIAAGFGYIDIVKLLMENGAVVHQQNKKKQTAMDVACENNHYGVVNVLLTASSKLIEDTTDKNHSQNNYSQPISSSLSKSLFIKSPSINNSHHIISRMKPDFQGISNLEYKRRTIGSQNQLCTSPEKPKPKKSGSLNTVYLNDNGFDDSCKKVYVNESIDDCDNKSNLSEIEVSLPYPSKFSTSEKLKIKSPLLTTKNWKVDKRVRRNNPSIIDSYSDQYSAQFFYPTECQTSPSIIRVPVENPSSPSRPLSSSCKFEKENLTKQTSMSSINNPNMVYFLKPHNSLSSNLTTDPQYASTSYFRKTQSVRRGFGSESDINDSPNRKSSKDDTLKPKSNTRTTYVKSPSLHDYASTKNENNNPTENNSNGLDEEYTCSKWIKNLGLFRIWDTLFKEGFDSFLSLSLATDDELLLLCDNNIEDWDKLKKNLELLKIPNLTELKFSTRISDLLFQLGLECYINNFNNNGYLYTNQTSNFEEINLNKLQIIKIGHRKLLLKCLSIIHNVESNNSEKSSSPFSINESPMTNIFDDSKYFSNNRNSPIFKNDDENEIENESFELPERNTSQMLNTFNEINHYPVIMSKKPPPPIPNRSSSIFENSSNLTLKDILSATVREKTKKNTNRAVSVNIKPADPSSLDDIVNILQNLGKELDQELNNVHA